MIPPVRLEISRDPSSSVGVVVDPFFGLREEDGKRARCARWSCVWCGVVK